MYMYIVWSPILNSLFVMGMGSSDTYMLCICAKKFKYLVNSYFASTCK